MPYLLFGQSQEQKMEGYVINGILDGNYKGEKVYLMEEDRINGSSKAIDSCVVVDNKYTFKGGKRDIVKMYFIKSGDPKCLSAITPFFLENGVIHIRANADFFMNAKVEGTINNDILSFYNFQTRYLVDSVQKQFSIENKIYGDRGNEIENLEYKRRSEALTQRLGAIQLNMAKQYKDQVFGPFMVCWALRNRLSIEELKSLRSQFDKKLEGHPYLEQLDEHIRLAQFDVGSMIPEFSLPDIKGNMISVSKFRGKYLLIDFWASWCGPCLREMPHVVELYRSCQGKNFEILGISLDSKKEAWSEAVKKNGMKWTQVSDLKMWQTLPVRLCNVQAVPYTILVDPKGEVIALNLRGEELIAKVKEIVGNK